jgi:hypothetical protein
VASIEFINNQPCVDLIEKAILPKLDDMNVSTWDKTDEQFLDQLSRTQKDSKYFGTCLWRSLFVIGRLVFHVVVVALQGVHALPTTDFLCFTSRVRSSTTLRASWRRTTTRCTRIWKC